MGRSFSYTERTRHGTAYFHGELVKADLHKFVSSWATSPAVSNRTAREIAYA